MKPKKPRAERCAYLTPKDVYTAMWDWWESTRSLPPVGSMVWLDPACGDGRLLQTPHARGSEVFGVDIQPECGQWFKDNGQVFTLVEDSLVIDWPKNAEVVMNPPFGTRGNDLAGAFLRKMINHCTLNRRWGIALQLSSVLQAQRRCDIRLPDFKLDLTWRPQFEGSKEMSGGYFKDFSWFIYAPAQTGTCKNYRLRRSK